jgi:hypothetical protein
MMVVPVKNAGSACKPNTQPVSAGAFLSLLTRRWLASHQDDSSPRIATVATSARNEKSPPWVDLAGLQFSAQVKDYSAAIHF